MGSSSDPESYDPKDRSFSPLELYDPRADLGRRYKVLKPGDRFYATAAAVMQVAEALPATKRRALLYALAEDWPRVSGRNSDRDWIAVRVLARYRQGWSPDELARALDRTRDTVMRWIKYAERNLEDEERVGVEPQINAVEGHVPSLEGFERVRASEKTIARRQAILDAERRLVEQLPVEMRAAALAWGRPGDPVEIAAKPGQSAQTKYAIGLPPERETATRGRRRKPG